MKRALLAAGVAATAVSAIVVGGLAAVSPPQPQSPGSDTSYRSLVLAERADAAYQTRLRSETTQLGELNLFPGPLPIAAHPAPPALPTSAPASPRSENLATPTPAPTARPQVLVRVTPAPAPPAPRTSGTPSVAAAQAYALSVIGSTQYSCLYLLFKRESDWNPYAYNRSSGAYGIPQALPGSKMGTVAPDWRTNPITQVKWGLGYISSRYGTACAAWAHSQAHGWY